MGDAMNKLVLGMLGAVVLGLGVIFVSQFTPALIEKRVSLQIVSGSENKALEPIIKGWARRENVTINISYMGSVEISQELGMGAEGAFDAVWPANSLWIELGDTQKVVKHEASILRSPVVLGLKKSIAEDLDWVGDDQITVKDIEAAAQNNDFRLAMTSATQSNSGASAYFGFLYALSGNPDVLTLDDLGDESVIAGAASLLAQVDRSSGSSGWLKDSFVKNPSIFDAMFNYEALLIEANTALEAAGEEPLYAVYPADGMSVADSPLGYVDRGDERKEKAFLALQAHLLSGEVQDRLVGLGRRAGLLGLSTDNADPAIWRKDWGIDLNRAISPVPTPANNVIAEALTLYQTELRKPSMTVWVLDVSGSMKGQPLEKLKEAMTLLLDPDASAVNFLQPTKRDSTFILPFNSEANSPEMFLGNDPETLQAARDYVSNLTAGGGTDLYGALIVALRQLYELKPLYYNGVEYDNLPAIVVMTDGASDTHNRERFLKALEDFGFKHEVPIHSIVFGNADEQQLRELSEATIGRVFRSDGNLEKALRSAKGYN